MSKRHRSHRHGSLRLSMAAALLSAVACAQLAGFEDFSAGASDRPPGNSGGSTASGAGAIGVRIGGSATGNSDVGGAARGGAAGSSDTAAGGSSLGGTSTTGGIASDGGTTNTGGWIATGAAGAAAAGGGSNPTGGTTAAGGGSSLGGTSTTGGTASDGGTANTGGRIATGAAGAAAAGGGSNPTGGTTAAGGTPGAGGSATGGVQAAAGAAGASAVDQTCTDVCAMLATRTTPLACMPSPCAATCAAKYENVAAASASCGANYLALLDCGASKPADSWVCYAVPLSNATIPLPPYTNGAPDGCQSEFDALYSEVMANLTTCGTALAQ